MIHITKYTQEEAPTIIAWITRRAKKPHLVVERALTGKNWYIAPVGERPKEIVPEQVSDRYDERLRQIYIMNRTDIVTLADLMIARPADLPVALLPRFFTAAVEYAAIRYGNANVVAGCIHCDEPETGSHVHILFVPARFDPRRGRDKACAYKVLDRSDFLTLRPDFEDHLSRQLSFPIRIPADRHGRTGKKHQGKVKSAVQKR